MTAKRRPYRNYIIEGGEPVPAQKGDTVTHVLVNVEYVADLERWKAEAMELLSQWHEVSKLVEQVQPTALGHSRVANAHRFVEAAVAHYAEHCAQPTIRRVEP